MDLYGRRRIVTKYDDITPGNVIDFLCETLPVHHRNAEEMVYLFEYYRGKQPILQRVKDVRPEIVDNTVINRATEIVNFKVSYLLSEPVMFIGRHGKQGETEEMNRLNDLLYAADKAVHDKEIADDFNICGQAIRMVYHTEKGSELPFEDMVLKPNKAYIAYKASASKNSRKVAGVVITDNGLGGRMYDVYTPTQVITVGWANELAGTVSKDAPVRSEPNHIGMIPMVEYTNNQFRIGAFESVIKLLDSANLLESNRIEATEQAVQNMTWFNDIELEAESKSRLEQKQSAFIFTKTIPGSTKPSIEVVATDLKQSDQQVLADDIYKNILRITGVPMTSDAETSDSSNNGSTIVRNGWQHAEARAKDTATLWERSDKEMLRVVLAICKLKGCGFDSIKPMDVEVKFTRRNYENIATKAAVLTQMLACDLIDPKTAWKASDMVPDVEEAYRQGMEYHEKRQSELRQYGQSETNGTAKSAPSDRITGSSASGADRNDAGGDANGTYYIRNGKRVYRRNRKN